MLKQGVSVRAISALTSRGLSPDAIWESLCIGESIDDHSMSGFNAAKHLSDKRLLKAVSPIDSYGLVAIDLLKSCLGQGVINQIEPERRGVFVGAASSSTEDNQNYLEIHGEALGSGSELAVQVFGEKCMDARPNTLLIGLPNNVLCYGSILLDARGANSNYISSETSSLLALEQASAAIRRGDLDIAVAGGFSSHGDAIDNSFYRQRGMGNIPFASGASFAWLENKTPVSDELPATELVNFAFASSLFGPTGNRERDVESVEQMIRRCLREVAVEPTDVGMIFLNDGGLEPLDRAEFMALSAVFGDDPVYLTTTGACGNLCEAGGVLEISFAQKIYQERKIPELLFSDRSSNAQVNGHHKKFGLILRLSPWGEFATLLIRMGE